VKEGQPIALRGAVLQLLTAMYSWSTGDGSPATILLCLHGIPKAGPSTTWKAPHTPQQKAQGATWPHQTEPFKVAYPKLFFRAGL